MLLHRLPIFLCTTLVTLVFVTCGKKSAPRPPVPILPTPVAQTQILQAGERFLYSFQLPALSTDQQTPVQVTKVEIFRMKIPRTPLVEPTTPSPAVPSAEDAKPAAAADETTGGDSGEKEEPHPLEAPSSQTTSESATAEGQPAPAPVMEEPRSVDARDFEKNAERIAVVTEEQIGGYMREDYFVFSDPVSAASGSADRENWFYYAAKVYNQKNKSSAFPRFLALYPEVVPEAPSQFTAMMTEKRIELKWAAVSRDIAGNEIPAENVVYQVYRGGSANFAPLQPLNGQPLVETQYTDTGFRFGQTYYYFIRASIKGQRREHQSAESNAILLYPQDVFAPSAPQELNVVSAREGMVLIWAPNPEDDVAGYNIYRSTEPGQGYEKVNQQLVRETTFTDPDIEPGKTYHYVITAADTAPKPNESAYSNEVSETKRTP